MTTGLVPGSWNADDIDEGMRKYDLGDVHPVILGSPDGFKAGVWVKRSRGR